MSMEQLKEYMTMDLKANSKPKTYSRGELKHLRQQKKQEEYNRFRNKAYQKVIKGIKDSERYRREILKELSKEKYNEKYVLDLMAKCIYAATNDEVFYIMFNDKIKEKKSGQSVV